MPRYTSENRDYGIVMCNGAELKCVTEVDTDLGFAIVLERDGAGNFVRENDDFKRRLILGRMEFIPTLDEA